VNPQEVYDEFVRVQALGTEWRTSEWPTDSLEFAVARGRIMGLAEALVRHMPCTESAALLGRWAARQEAWPMPSPSFQHDSAQLTLDAILWKKALDYRIENYSPSQDGI